MPTPPEYTVTLDLEFWETYGANSLLGLVMDWHPEIKEGDTLMLKFCETSTAWRAQNGGPKLLIAHEFMPSCFAQDLRKLFGMFNIQLTAETV